jgi:hypothetical protein
MYPMNPLISHLFDKHSSDAYYVTGIFLGYRDRAKTKQTKSTVVVHMF